MTVRNYAVLYLNGRRTRSGVVVGGGGVITEGGNGVLQTGQHALDGAEHTGQLPETRLSTAATDTDLRLAPDGTGGVEWAATAAGFDTPFDHGSMGATETIDLADGTWHRGTLTANCTITVTGYAVDEGVVALVKLTQDGTGGWDITWDPDVLFAGDDQPGQAASAVTWFLLWSDEGDATVYGAIVGGGSSSPLTTKGDLWGYDTADARVPVGANGYLLTPDSTDAQGVVWKNPETTGHYEVLMDGASPPAALENGSGTDWLYVWVP